MEVKGTAVASIPKFIEDKFGADGLKRWLESLNADANYVYSVNILPGKWYSLYEILVEPTRQLCNVFYGGNMKGAWETGRFNALYGLT